MLARRVIAVWCACWLGAGALRAEEALPQVGASGEPLEQVVVTSEPPQAPEIERRIFADGPVEMQIIGAEEIRRMPATHVADVVSKLAGIRVQQRVQGEKAAVSIEGMPPTYTLILVDGQPYSGELGDVHDLRDVPLANVERIEVTRAAGAVVHGPEAAGGVINVITRAPPREGWAGELHGGWGSDGKILSLSSLGVGNERLAGSLSFAHDQQDGFDSPDDITNAVSPGSGGSDSRNTARDALATIDVSPTPRLDLRTRAGWRLENEDVPLSADGDDFMAGRNYQRWLVQQHAGYELGDRARVDGAFRWFDGSTDSDIGRTFEMDEDEYGLQLSAKAPLDFHRFENGLTFGVDAKRPHLQLDEEPSEFPDPILDNGDADEHFEMAGFYALVDTELLDWVALQTGVRADVHSEFDPTFSPQVALLFSPWIGEGERYLKFRVSYGHSNRTPSLRDLFQPPTAQLQGAYFLAGNPDLSPESSNSYRAGFDFAPISSLALSATGFWNDIDDHIRSLAAGSVLLGTETLPPVLPPSRPGLELICKAVNYALPECGTPVVVDLRSPLFQKTNLDRVRTRGVEANLLWTPHRNFDLRLGYTFLNTKVLDSNISIDELPNEAPHSFDARVSALLPWIDTRITGQVAWRDSSFTELSGTGLPTFSTANRSHRSTIVDFRVSRALPILDWVEVAADLYNATDERVVDSYVVRGRTFFLSVYARFP